MQNPESSDSRKKAVRLLRDVSNAPYQSYSAELGRLVNFLARDPVYGPRYERLMTIDSVDFEKWYERFAESGGSMAGSKQLQLPDDEPDRSAILLRLMSAVADGTVELVWFCIDAFGESRPDAVTQSFSQYIVRPFAEEFFAEA